MILAHAFLTGLLGLAPASAQPDSAALLAPAAAAAITAPAGSAALAPIGAAVPAPADSAAAMQEAVNLTARGAFSNPAPRVGDSLEYVITAEWEETQVPVLVLAPDSSDFPGFRLLGQATQHKKLANAQGVRNHTEFIYSLRATAQGPGKAASLKVRYLTGLSRNEEAVYVPTALVDIAPAPVRLLDLLAVKLALWLAFFAAAVAAGWAAFKLAARKRAEARPKRADLRPEAEALKARMRIAQNNPESSKAILLEMESLAIRFLKEETGETSAAARFETLLKTYLSKGPGGSDRAGDAGVGAARPGDQAGDWARLGDLFRHARFAGGYKEPHELQDAFRILRKCLKIQAEEEL